MTDLAKSCANPWTLGEPSLALEYEFHEVHTDQRGRAWMTEGRWVFVHDATPGFSALLSCWPDDTKHRLASGTPTPAEAIPEQHKSSAGNWKTTEPPREKCRWRNGDEEGTARPSSMGGGPGWKYQSQADKPQGIERWKARLPDGWEWSPIMTDLEAAQAAEVAAIRAHQAAHEAERAADERLVLARKELQAAMLASGSALAYSHETGKALEAARGAVVAAVFGVPS